MAEIKRYRWWCQMCGQTGTVRCDPIVRRSTAAGAHRSCPRGGLSYNIDVTPIFPTPMAEALIATSYIVAAALVLAVAVWLTT